MTDQTTAGARAPAGSPPGGAGRRYVKIFDTTLRDGEQAPGASMNETEKLEIARQLERMGVDVIEAGFPVASKGDFESVALIAREVKGLAHRRSGPRHRAGRARLLGRGQTGRGPPHPHVLSTSPIHMKYQIKKTPEQVRAITREMVGLAARLAAQHAGADVEFSAMDASRSEPEFLAEIFGIAIECGATTINVPDTVGYALPLELGRLHPRAVPPVPGLERRHGQRALPQRPRPGDGQLAGGRAGRRHPGRVRRQRYRRAGRQRLARRGRHGPGHAGRLLRRGHRHRHDARSPAAAAW